MFIRFRKWFQIWWHILCKTFFCFRWTRMKPVMAMRIPCPTTCRSTWWTKKPWTVVEEKRLTITTNRVHKGMHKGNMDILDNRHKDNMRTLDSMLMGNNDHANNHNKPYWKKLPQPKIWKCWYNVQLLSDNILKLISHVLIIYCFNHKIVPRVWIFKINFRPTLKVG